MLNPSTSFHDYENLALININRNAYASQFASGGGGESGVRHWKTYSDMAEGELARPKLSGEIFIAIGIIRTFAKLKKYQNFLLLSMNFTGK